MAGINQIGTLWNNTTSAVKGSKGGNRSQVSCMPNDRVELGKGKSTPVLSQNKFLRSGKTGNSAGKLFMESQKRAKINSSTQKTVMPKAPKKSLKSKPAKVSGGITIMPFHKVSTKKTDVMPLEKRVRNIRALTHHPRGDVEFFQHNPVVKAAKESLNTLNSFQNFIRKFVTEPISKSGLNQDDVLITAKRSLYYATMDSPRLQKDLHNYIGRLCSSPKGTQMEKVGKYLKDSYTVKDLVWVSTEAKPFSTSGGLGTVMGELPKALAKKGFNVKVITPKYQQFRTEKDRKRMEKAIDKYGMKWSGKNREFFVRGSNTYTEGIYTGKVDGVEYVLLDNPQLFDGLYYGQKCSEKIDRSVGLARGAIEAMKALDMDPSLIYANDASAGPLPVIAAHDPWLRGDSRFRDIADRTCFIIHNPGWKYQNKYPKNEEGKNNIEAFNIPEPSDNALTKDLEADVDPGSINLMEAAIKTSGNSIAVSPTTAGDVNNIKDGMQTGGKKVEGILNGIPADYYQSSWNYIKTSAGDGMLVNLHGNLKEHIKNNPELAKKVKERFPEIMGDTKKLLEFEDTRENRYTMHNWLKMTVQMENGFKVDPDIPLLTMIHRITDQKGFDLVIDAQNEIMNREDGEVQFIAGGPIDTSDPDNCRIRDGLRGMESRNTDKMKFMEGFADMRLYASASDIFLMPSKEEPCGISNLEAASLGNVVVVHATGGLKDSMVPIKKELGDWKRQGNGFLFNTFNKDAFAESVNSAIDFIKTASDKEKIQSREWATNNIRSWDDAADEYAESMYRQLEIVPGGK